MKDWAVKIGFPPTSLFPPAEFVWDDLTCRVPTSPPPPPPVENAMLDKRVCGDEQPIEWPAKVAMLEESPFCPLISIWKTTTYCKCFMTSSKGQSGGTKFYHCYLLGMACILIPVVGVWNSCCICDKTYRNHPCRIHQSVTFSCLVPGFSFLSMLNTSVILLLKPGKKQTGKETSDGRQCWHRKELTCIL